MLTSAESFYVFNAPAPRLPMRVTLTEPLDDDELFKLCRANPELRIERDETGVLTVMPPTGGETGRRNFKLAGRFAAWSEQDGTGIGFGSSTGFVLPNGAERSPDVAWLKKERWDRLTQAQREKFVPLAPDFVVELRSRSDKLKDLQEKMREYVSQGVRLAWLLDPETKSVWVYRPGMAPEERREVTVMDGAGVLPGLALTLSDLW